MKNIKTFAVVFLTTFLINGFVSPMERKNLRKERTCERCSTTCWGCDKKLEWDDFVFVFPCRRCVCCWDCGGGFVKKGTLGEVMEANQEDEGFGMTASACKRGHIGVPSGVQAPGESGDFALPKEVEDSVNSFVESTEKFLAQFKFSAFLGEIFSSWSDVRPVLWKMGTQMLLGKDVEKRIPRKNEFVQILNDIFVNDQKSMIRVMVNLGVQALTLPDDSRLILAQSMAQIAKSLMSPFGDEKIENLNGNGEKGLVGLLGFLKRVNEFASFLSDQSKASGKHNIELSTKKVVDAFFEENEGFKGALVRCIKKLDADADTFLDGKAKQKSHDAAQALLEIVEKDSPSMEEMEL